jgi:hypothetical protein
MYLSGAKDQRVPPEKDDELKLTLAVMVVMRYGVDWHSTGHTMVEK